MKLFSETELDRYLQRRWHLIVGGLALMGLVLALPPGWGTGFFSGFMIFSLGIYAMWFQKYRSDPGLWMLSVLLTVLLAPGWAYFEYLHLRTILAAWGPNRAQPNIRWDSLRLSIDAVFALLLFSQTLKFFVSVGIWNWRRTRYNRC